MSKELFVNIKNLKVYPSNNPGTFIVMHCSHMDGDITIIGGADETTALKECLKKLYNCFINYYI